MKRPNKRRPVVAMTADGRGIAWYLSIHAAERCGYRGSCIRRCLAGRQRTHGGWRWREARHG